MGTAERLPARVVPMGRQQHLFSIFQRSDHYCFGDSHGRGEPVDRPARWIRNLTFKTTTDEDRAKTRASWSWREVAGSAVVPVRIPGAYLYFRDSPVLVIHLS